MLRKAFGWLVLAFIVLMVVRNPHGAATTARGIGSWLSTAASGVGTFVSSLVGGGR